MPDVAQEAAVELGECTHCGAQNVVIEFRDEIYGATYCGPCTEVRTAVCTHCDTRVRRVDTYSSIDGRICAPCSETEICCYVCGLYGETDDFIEVPHGSDSVQVCSGCVQTCNGCGEPAYDEYCQSCQTAVQGYGYRPIPIFYRGKTERQDTYFLGFEVEVEGRRRPPKQMPEWVYCKEDGSLDDGFEVVSHPLSSQWIRENQHQIKTLLRVLRDGGWESDTTDTCGMHIHVSRTAFDGTFHLLKFLEMFYRWPGWTLIMSEREREKLEQWANTGESREDIYRKAKIKANDHGERYTAVNLENHHTFEVRIFRGTIESLSFFKNLQYVEALVEFTRDASRQKATPKGFRAWVKPQGKRYPELVKWLEDRGHFD